MADQTEKKKTKKKTKKEEIQEDDDDNDDDDEDDDDDDDDDAAAAAAAAAAVATDDASDEGVLSEELQNMSLDMWPESELNTELDDLHLPAIRPGKGYIYPLWKSLLSRWLSSSCYKVYLATPFLDVKRMTDIYTMVIKNPTKANIEAFFVRNNCFNNPFKKIRMNITQVQKEAGEQIQKIGKIQRESGEKFKEKVSSEELSKIISEKIAKKLKVVHPNFDNDTYFHAKFIGCTCEYSAEVLVTSANFSDNHFDIENEESVVYFTMTKEQFVERFVNPLQSLITK